LCFGFAVIYLLATAQHGLCDELAATVEDTIGFGIPLALNPPPGQSFQQVQRECLVGLEVWRDWWNGLPAANRARRYGPPFKVDLVVSSSASDYTDNSANLELMYNVYRDMVHNSSVSYLFGPVASPWGYQVRNFTLYELNVPIMIGMYPSRQSRVRYSSHSLKEHPC